MYAFLELFMPLKAFAFGAAPRQPAPRPTQ